MPVFTRQNTENMEDYPGMSAFFRKTAAAPAAQANSDFGYLPEDVCYLDSACQTLRPVSVIEAERDYYLTMNACGGRVKYRWGKQVDERVDAAREKLLKMLGKSSKDYCVAFTLNTTTGINLVASQLSAGKYQRIVTSEIEHNSVFLPSIAWAKKNEKARLVLPRAEDGSLIYKPEDVLQSVVLVNSTSNIDGRVLKNAVQLANDTRKNGGLLLIDAAQSFAHGLDHLRGADFDALFGSGHKMYGPSIGFIVIRRELLRSLDIGLVGGGTVSDVDKDSFISLLNTPEEHGVLELGLQNWAGIVGLNTAIDWINAQGEGSETDLAGQLFNGLKEIPKVHVVNSFASPIVSIFIDDLDSHRLALYLDEQGIMCRSGYFCCHYYIKHLKKMPPLLRLSLGRSNTAGQVSSTLEIIRKITQSL